MRFFSENSLQSDRNSTTEKSGGRLHTGALTTCADSGEKRVPHRRDEVHIGRDQEQLGSNNLTQRRLLFAVLLYEATQYKFFR
jgi:hypothetical protein